MMDIFKGLQAPDTTEYDAALAERDEADASIRRLHKRIQDQTAIISGAEERGAKLELKLNQLILAEDSPEVDADLAQCQQGLDATRAEQRTAELRLAALRDGKPRLAAIKRKQAADRAVELQHGLYMLALEQALVDTPIGQQVREFLQTLAALYGMERTGQLFTDQQFENLMRGDEAADHIPGPVPRACPSGLFLSSDDREFLRRSERAATRAA